MFRDEFELGGPVMYVIFGVWVAMLALILERVLFWVRGTLSRALGKLEGEQPEEALALRVQELAEHNLSRIEGLSQLATGLGLFGTVLGIARAFFARGDDLSLAAPEVFASGLATALFTTVAGLAVFLVGQLALLVFNSLTETFLRRLRERQGTGGA